MKQSGFILLPILFLAVILTVISLVVVLKTDLLDKLIAKPSPTGISETVETPLPSEVANPTTTHLPSPTPTVVPSKKPATSTSTPKPSPTKTPTFTPTPTPTPTPYSPSGPTVSLTGRVYSDANCNNLQEPSEGGVAGVTVNIFLIPSYALFSTVTSDSSGYFNFTTQLASSNSYIDVKPSALAPSGYKIYFSAQSISLGSGQTSFNTALPLVPNQNVGLCN